MQIGEKLKQKRNEAGLSQEVLAEKIGVSRQTVSNWENNRSYPDIGSVLRLSDLYGISLDELLKEDTNMRKHVEETAKLPARWMKFLCGLTIALLPLNALLHYWGADTAAMVLKILSVVLIPVLIFARWKFTGGEKKELYIIMGFYAFIIIGEVITLGRDFLRSSNFLMVGMVFVLIYGYGHYLGKGLPFWLLLFLYFGTPVYMAVDARLPEFLAMEPAYQSDLCGDYIIQEVLYGDDCGYPQIAVDSADYELTIGGESMGILRYTKPLENQQDLYAVWQLVPEEAPNTLYRLEVDDEMNKTLSCIADDQLQWKWLLGSLPEVKCLESSWKETGGYYSIRWYSAAEPLDDQAYPLVLSEPDTLFISWSDESVTTLTVEETIGDGQPILHTLHRNEDGYFPLGEVFPESGVIHTYRIEYLGGAFILQVKSLP